MPETFAQSPYDPHKFIDREEEINNIISILQHTAPRTRAFVIEGDRGIGKTWLSLHLHRTKFKEVPGLTSWLFSLAYPGDGYRPGGEVPEKNEHFVMVGEQLDIDEFLHKIASSLLIELPSDSTIPEIVEIIRRYVQNHGDERFVLILDSAYESDWTLLETLETHFIGNMLTLNNFFVIVTGRGRPYPWKIPALIEAVRFGLGNFTVGQIEEQLDTIGLASVLSAQDIYNIGEGWPIFTEALTGAKKGEEAIDIAVNLLFQVVPAQERPQIRRYFEALCPLDGFGETEAALMVKTYDPESGEQDGRSICKKMNETRLISWKNGRYVINRPVLNILRQYLPLNKRDEWIRLNFAAYRRFQHQSSDPTLNRFHSFFEDQMKIHASALNDVGVRDVETHSRNEI